MEIAAAGLPEERVAEPDAMALVFDGEESEGDEEDEKRCKEQSDQQLLHGRSYSERRLTWPFKITGTWARAQVYGASRGDPQKTLELRSLPWLLLQVGSQFRVGFRNVQEKLRWIPIRLIPCAIPGQKRVGEPTPRGRVLRDVAEKD